MQTNTQRGLAPEAAELHAHLLPVTADFLDKDRDPARQGPAQVAADMAIVVSVPHAPVSAWEEPSAAGLERLVPANN